MTIVGNPFFGRMSDRTASPWGMRRPWMVIGLLGGSLGILVVALAPAIPVVLAGWCLAQLLFNAVLAAMVAVLPDQVPETQRGMMAGVLGVATPIASVLGRLFILEDAMSAWTGRSLASEVETPSLIRKARLTPQPHRRLCRPTHPRPSAASKDPAVLGITTGSA